MRCPGAALSRCCPPVDGTGLAEWSQPGQTPPALDPAQYPLAALFGEAPPLRPAGGSPPEVASGTATDRLDLPAVLCWSEPPQLLPGEGACQPVDPDPSMRWRGC